MDKLGKSKSKSAVLPFVFGALLMLCVIMVAAAIILFTNVDCRNRAINAVNGLNAGYELADYDKYNTTDNDDIEGDEIYINVSKFTVDTDSGVTYAMCKTTDGEWLVPLTLITESSISSIESYNGNIEIYGTYLGYSDNVSAPSILPTRIVAGRTGYNAVINSGE